MTLKPLIALTDIHLTVETGKHASKDTPAVPPVTRVIESFRKSGKAFMAVDMEQQDELFDLKCVDFAPQGTPLDPEAVVADAAPVKKAAPAATKPKAPAEKTKPPAEKIADKNDADAEAKAKAAAEAAAGKSSADAAVEKAAWNGDVSNTSDDGNGMI